MGLLYIHYVSICNLYKYICYNWRALENIKITNMHACSLYHVPGLPSTNKTLNKLYGEVDFYYLTGFWVLTRVESNPTTTCYYIYLYLYIKRLRVGLGRLQSLMCHIICHQFVYLAWFIIWISWQVKYKGVSTLHRDISTNSLTLCIILQYVFTRCHRVSAWFFKF